MKPKKTGQEQILEKTSGPQHRDFSDVAGPAIVTMSMEDCQSACKAIGVEYKKGYEQRILKYTCSDSSVDRMGDVIKQEGWKLESFKKNPVIMGFHDYGTFPVGNALSVGVVDGKLKMNILFADKDVNEDADTAFKMAKSGFMKAGSVGFRPLKYHASSEQEQKELGMGKYGIMFEEQELMEFSVCGVPANANALQESISKGMFKKSDFQNWVKQETYNLLEEPPTEPTLPPSPIPVLSEETLKQIADYLKTLTPPVEEKAGAVLSKKNKEAIGSAISGMKSAVEALETLLNTATTTESEPESDPDEKSVIEINLDSSDDSESTEDLYTDESIINITI